MPRSLCGDLGLVTPPLGSGASLWGGPLSSSGRFAGGQRRSRGSADRPSQNTQQGAPRLCFSPSHLFDYRPQSPCVSLSCIEKEILKDFYKDFFEREVYTLYRAGCQERLLVGNPSDVAHWLASRWRPPPKPRYDRLLVHSNARDKVG